MVRGLQLFTAFFSDYRDQYVLIGGTACHLHMEDAGLEFRATRDLDIVLCVEALTPEFITRFWEFIQGGGYELKERADGTLSFYRFSRPSDMSYPAMLELFARNPSVLEHTAPNQNVITRLSVEDEVVSLSAILLDEDYYTFINSEKTIVAGVPIASIVCLIALKARAWIDLSEQRSLGASIDANTISKHKRDVFRISQLLNDKQLPVVSAGVQSDMARFLTHMESEDIDVRQLGIVRSSKPEIIKRLRHTYGIED